MAESLRGQQARFAAHLRNPDAHPPPSDVAPDRMAVYRQLFFGNVETLLANAFPVLRSVLEDCRWQTLVRTFYARHAAQTPLFRKLAEEFVEWLDQRDVDADDPPFVAQLAHYEWVELALATAEDPLPATAVLADPNGDLLAAPPVLSPLCWTLAYDWPVQRIGPSFQPTAASGVQTFLLVHRSASDAVQFIEINAVTARLLTLAEERPTASGLELLEQIADELQRDDVDEVVAAGAAILDSLRERGIVLGTRRRLSPSR